MVQTVHCLDIAADGRAAPVTEPAPAAGPAAGYAYRWLHFDVAAEGLGAWLASAMPALAAETLLQAETRPRCDALAGGLVLNLRGVNLNPESRAEDMVSLRVWATETLVVTTRVRRVMTMESIVARCAAGDAPPTVAAFLAAVADGLTDRTEAVAIGLEDRTDALEEAEISGAPIAAEEVAALRRAVAMIRRFAAPQREALTRLAALDGAPMTSDAADDVRETANRAARNAEALEALRERLAVLQDALASRADQAMGRNSYVLGVVAAIFLPLGFLTGLFGVNVGGMPGIDSASAFWWLTGAMAVIGVGLTAVFRLMRWF